MSRTLFVVLAVLALILSVSAQSQTSSSSSSSNSLSSSSSFVTASSSTGRSSTSSSASSSASSSSSSSSTGAAAFTTSSSSSSSSGSSSTGVSTGSNPVTPGGSSSNSSSSTGSTNQLYVTSSSSSSAGYYPDGSVGGNININIPDDVTAAVAAPLLQKDIAANVANESGIANANAVVPYVVITSFRGTALAPSSRRLLQTTSGVAAVTFIILGNITNLASQAANGFSVSGVLTTLQAAAQTGRLTASNLQAAGINATIPAQTIAIFVPGQSSTGGVGYNGASTVVSTGAALIAAAVASLALLL